MKNFTEYEIGMQQDPENWFSFSELQKIKPISKDELEVISIGEPIHFDNARNQEEMSYCLDVSNFQVCSVFGFRIYKNEIFLKEGELPLKAQLKVTIEEIVQKSGLSIASLDWDKYICTYLFDYVDSDSMTREAFPVLNVSTLESDLNSLLKNSSDIKVVLNHDYNENSVRSKLSCFDLVDKNAKLKPNPTNVRQTFSLDLDEQDFCFDIYDLLGNFDFQVSLKMEDFLKVSFSKMKEFFSDYSYENRIDFRIVGYDEKFIYIDFIDDKVPVKNEDKIESALK